MDGVAMLAESYEIPAAAAVQSLLKEGKPFHADGAEMLRVRYSRRIARWIAEREKVPLADDGSLTIDHPLADEDWAVRHVLQYGPEAEVLSPPRARAAVRAKLRQLAAQA
jgi:predicted DNA-binding transcriptional regulator YafY